MRSLLARMPSTFATAAAIAAACAAIAVAVLITTPPPPPNDEFNAFRSLEHVRSHALSSVGMLLLAFWLRHRQEAASYTLLAGSGLVAGWAIDAVWHNSIEAEQPAFPLLVLALLATVAAPTAILALFAATARRRLFRSIHVVLAALVAGVIAAIAVVTAMYINGWGGNVAYPGQNGLAESLAGGLTTQLPLFLVIALAALGSLRNEGIRFVPSGAAPSRHPAPDRALRVAFAVTFAVAIAMFYVWAIDPEGDADQLLLPLLAALVGVVAARWSATIAWAAMSFSIAIGTLTAFSNAIDIAVKPLVDNPEAPLAPMADWIVPLAVGVVLVISSIPFAAFALRAARAGIPGRTPRITLAPAPLTLVILGLAAWVTYLWQRGFGDLRYPVLEVSLYGISLAGFCLSGLLIVGAAEALRGRLVPAIAEAEVVARNPLRPFRYLETVVIEALTGRAALRRVATAAERTRLASDLHAELLPSIAEIAAEYEAGAPQADVAQRLRRLESEIRDLMAERRLVVLEEFGIVEAIEWLVGRAEERMALDVELSVSDRTTAERPPREVERAAFRIAQLAVENALQHAAPTRLALDVLARPDEVRISISDDGRGLAGAEAAERNRTRDHVGIADMRSQAADVRGDVQVVEPAAGGTTVTFAWPAI